MGGSSNIVVVFPLAGFWGFLQTLAVCLTVLVMFRLKATQAKQAMPVLEPEEVEEETVEEEETEAEPEEHEHVSADPNWDPAWGDNPNDYGTK